MGRGTVTPHPLAGAGVDCRGKQISRDGPPSIGAPRHRGNSQGTAPGAPDFGVQRDARRPDFTPHANLLPYHPSGYVRQEARHHGHRVPPARTSPVRIPARHRLTELPTCRTRPPLRVVLDGVALATLVVTRRHASFVSQAHQVKTSDEIFQSDRTGPANGNTHQISM
jgi:hypothetical protein